MADEEDDSIQEHAKELFSKPPMEPNSTPLILADETLEANEDISHAEIVTNILYRILMAGLPYLFGEPPYDWTQLTKDKLLLVQQYMASLGVQLKLGTKYNIFCFVFDPIRENAFPPNMQKYVFPLCRLDELIPELRNSLE